MKIMTPTFFFHLNGSAISSTPSQPRSWAFRVKTSTRDFDAEGNNIVSQWMQFLDGKDNELAFVGVN